MTQDERWKANWQEVMDFMEVNKRRPSKYVPEEKLMVRFLKRGRKLMNAGEMKEERVKRWSRAKGHIRFMVHGS